MPPAIRTLSSSCIRATAAACIATCCARSATRRWPPAPSDGDERTARVPDPDTPERNLSDFEQRRRLQLALAELPEDQREVLQLRLEQELSLEEIGQITGVGRETVKSRLRYAMDKLRTRLNE